MSIEALLQELAANNVKLSVKDGKLVCQLPEGGIDGDLMNKLKQFKDEIIQFILDTCKSKFIRSPIKKQSTNALAKPVSHAQQRLWVLDQIEGSKHYSILNGLLLTGDLDTGLFQKVFDTTLARHEVLRTTYNLDERGNLYQEVQPFRPMEITMKDLRNSSTEEQGIIIEKLQLEEYKYTFNLKKDVMIRVVLIQIKDAEFVVLVNMHHIATDGWSIGILIREFNALYTAFHQGRRCPLDGLDIQYSDYAYWQHETLRGEKLDELKRYWLNQLSDLPPVHSLPLDYIRPKTQTFAGDTIFLQIGINELNSLKRICDQEGATLFAGLYTIFAILLARYSNERDIVIGTPVANREQPEIENLIGLFVNMLLLRSNVSRNAGFMELLHQNKQMLYGAFSHQQMPFDMLVSELRPLREVSYSSLFQIMFVLQNNEKAKLELPDLTLMQIEQSKPFAMYDLTLTVNENDNGLMLGWEYNTAIFKSLTIQRMANHFEQLFKSLVQFPHESVMKVNMMSDNEKADLTYSWNQTETDYPKNKTVIDLLDEQVKATPDHIAIKFGEKQYTYLQFNHLANQFADYLIKNYALTANDLVAVQLERSEKMPLAIISILKAGAAFVPVATDYLADRVNYILHDTKTKLLIDDREVEKFFSVREMYSAESISLKPVPGDLAYCIYTSGSTGVPKGVLNQHAGLFNRLLWMKEYLNPEGNEIYLQKTPYTFDVSVWEFLLPVISGGTLIVSNPEGHKDPEYLIELIRKEKISIIHFVPSMLSVFLQFASDKDVSDLRHIICSGEELLPGMVAQSRIKFPQTRIHNFYGPTEAAIDVTAIDLTELDVSNGVSIGRPVANTRIYIVDDELNLLPAKIPGELLISGIQVARSYLNLKELTNEKFIQDPFIPGERVYRTGDIALWEESGTIKYLGRKDSQVKIRGNRIELGAITANLLLKPGIKEAAVTVYKKEYAEHELVAYVVADEIQNTTALRKFLSTKIPDYEIPSYFIQLDKMPLSANGKVDIKSLPSPEHNKLSTAIEYTPPKNDIEEKLVKIFANELGRNVKEIGVHDNFFDLGANSINLIRILNELNKEFGTDLKPVLLFQYTTIKVLVENMFDDTFKDREEEDDNTLSDEIDSLMDIMEE